MQKLFDKIQYSLMITLNKRGNIPHILKTLYERLTANVILSGEKLKAFHLRSGTRKGCPLTHFHSIKYWKS